ncbi:MAG: molybdopterin-dependent oxidoreductase, partial [bacterium]|nr:molybdopterin-dependent oxidoreductase [bacterium]
MSNQKKITRRSFLKASTISTVGLAVSTPLLTSLTFLPDIENPLEHYPEKGWEKIYRDQYKHDFTYHFLCAPNDTHNCLLKGYVKNGIVTRIGPSYGYGKAQDLYGNQASSRWEPRLCQKGLALVRRIYGPRRIQGAMVREGFYKWYKSGFEREADGRPPKKYHQRGKENFIKLPWDEAFEVAASAMIDIATTYSGDEGKALLEQQGNYDPDSIEAMNKAGTQAMKFRGGMPMLGVTRVFGMYRLANSMALVDTHVRGVSKDEAIGGRGFDNYTFHTDLPPGHPMVTGQQTIDWDLVSVEHTKLVIAWGMNWISTKMPDAHWLTEARIKGTKVISVTVEYSSVACKSDEVIIIRPASDPAFSLGLAHVIMRDKLYDEEYVESFTDLPLLVRMDTLKLLSAEDVIADFQAPAEHRDTVVMKAGESAPPPIKSEGKQHIPESLIDEWGNFVVWDKNKNAAVPITRDDVHKYFKEKGIKPELEFDGELQLLDGETVKVRSVYSLTWEYIRENFDPETTSKITWAP